MRRSDRGQIARVDTPTTGTTSAAMRAMSTKATTLAGGRGLVYAVHDGRAPSDEEWSEYVANCRALLERVSDGSKVGGLAITDGGAPNARQRRLVIGVVSELAGEGMARIRSSVISESALVRGVVTAFSWHIPEMRIFAPSAVRVALDHVDVTTAEIGVVLRDLEQLAALVPNARTVRVVIDRLRARRRR